MSSNIQMSCKHTQDVKNIEEDLNLIQYSEQKRKFYTIAWKNANDGSCCISDVIEESGFQINCL